jgi:hypothetical protein
MARRNLVVVRAGDSSLHPHWLAGGGGRNWDLAVSYFGDDPNLFKTDDVTRIDGKGPKWQGLHDVFSKRPEFLTNYDYILLPDDDLMASKDDLNRLFDICKTYGLEIGHPTLTWNSYYAHLVTLRNAGTRLRYTNFVEVMAPCLTKALLNKTLGYFAETLSGWGLEQAWAKSAGPMKMALIDEIAVRHTRPVGGPNYKALRDKNISPWDELRGLCRTLGVDEQPIIETYGAILANGRHIERAHNERIFDFRMLAGWLLVLKKTPPVNRRALAWRMAGYTYKALKQIPDRVIDYG